MPLCGSHRIALDGKPRRPSRAQAGEKSCETRILYLSRMAFRTKTGSFIGCPACELETLSFSCVVADCKCRSAEYCRISPRLVSTLVSNRIRFLPGDPERYGLPKLDLF